eukprot:Skav232405  [mRNA]  locus=scaffold1077:767154:796497:- [translate_table: standard]
MNPTARHPGSTLDRANAVSLQTALQLSEAKGSSSHCNGNWTYLGHGTCVITKRAAKCVRGDEAYCKAPWSYIGFERCCLTSDVEFQLTDVKGSSEYCKGDWTYLGHGTCVSTKPAAKCVDSDKDDCKAPWSYIGNDQCCSTAENSLAKMHSISVVAMMIEEAQLRREIGILDIYGFERLQRHSVSAAGCVGCVAPVAMTVRLWRLRNVLMAEQELYRREGLPWHGLELPDSTPDLIRRDFLRPLRVSKRRPMAANEAAVVGSSSFELVASLKDDDIGKAGRLRSGAELDAPFKSISKKYCADLETLLQTLGTCQLHYIRTLVAVQGDLLPESFQRYGTRTFIEALLLAYDVPNEENRGLGDVEKLKLLMWQAEIGYQLFLLIIFDIEDRAAPDAQKLRQIMRQIIRKKWIRAAHAIALCHYLPRRRWLHDVAAQGSRLRRARALRRWHVAFHAVRLVRRFTVQARGRAPVALEEERRRVEEEVSEKKNDEKLPRNRPGLKKREEELLRKRQDKRKRAEGQRKRLSKDSVHELLRPGLKKREEELLRKRQDKRKRAEGQRKRLSKESVHELLSSTAADFISLFLILIAFVCFLFMPLGRPHRSVRAAPYSFGGEAGRARPPLRLCLPKLGSEPGVINSLAVGEASSANVRLVAAPGGIAHAGLLQREMEAGKDGSVCGMNGAAAGVACRQLEMSARSAEDAQRLKLAGVWAGFARSVASSSTSVCDFADLPQLSLQRLFLDRAPSTLRRHLGGWRLWVAYCSLHNWQPGDPSMPALLDFLNSLSDGARQDRGAGRKRSALGVLSAMAFAAAKLSLTNLQKLLGEPLIQCWKSGDKWKCGRVKEAMPVPFCALQRLEEEVARVNGDDKVLLCAILLMAWGSLRWSDIQRLDLQSISCDASSVRGWCWRTKSSARGMPWGILRSGCAASNWGDVLFSVIQNMRTQQPARDFLVAWKGKPMPYAMMLAQFRRCLIVVAGLEHDVACKLTLHSLKCTLLSWALQCKIDAVERAAQGHHRHHGTSHCVQRYSRDDVAPQLSCQVQILAALKTGWRPGVPIQRGVGRLKENAVRADSETESASSASDSSSSSIPPSDSEGSDCNSDAPMSEAGDFDGPWMLNTLSGVVHKTIQIVGDKDDLFLACRPGAVLHDAYEKRTENPWFDGFRLCKLNTVVALLEPHVACRARMEEELRRAEEEEVAPATHGKPKHPAGRRKRLRTLSIIRRVCWVLDCAVAREEERRRVAEKEALIREEYQRMAEEEVEAMQEESREEEKDLDDSDLGHWAPEVSRCDVPVAEAETETVPWQMVVRQVVIGGSWGTSGCAGPGVSGDMAMGPAVHQPTIGGQ